MGEQHENELVEKLTDRTLKLFPLKGAQGEDLDSTTLSKAKTQLQPPDEAKTKKGKAKPTKKTKTAPPLAKPRAMLTEVENLGVGTAGGVTTAFATMPVLTWKFCSQEGRPLPRGLREWYRGSGLLASLVGPITAAQMVLNGAFEKYVFGATEANPINDVKKMCSACMAGACSALIMSPMELTMIHQQKRSLGPLQTLQWVYNTHGFKAIWRGFSAMAIREAIYTGGCLGLSPVLTKLIHEAHGSDNMPLVDMLVGSLVAGVSAAVLTHPADTVKTVYQADIGGAKYSSPLSPVPQLFSEGGLGAFYRGGSARTIQVCGAFFIITSMREAYTQHKTNANQTQTDALATPSTSDAR